MNIRTGLFGFLLKMAVLAAVFCTSGIYGEERLHTVQQGETFYSIARALGIKAEDLMKHNGITDPGRLQVGQRLRIPGSDTGGLTNYRVVRGDTLYSIARKYSVTVEAIREMNSLAANYVLREGDSLMLPIESPQGAALTTGVSTPSETAVPIVPTTVVSGSGTSAGTGVQSQTSSGTGAQSQTPQEKPAAVETGASSAIPSIRWPVTARELSYMTGKLSGVVITGTRAESVNSLTWGTVISAGPYRGFGRVVIIQVDGGYLYVYGGCDSLSVKEGDRVSPGSELGKLGLDAVSNKPQLFFMVYRSNMPVDPAKAPRA